MSVFNPLHIARLCCCLLFLYISSCRLIAQTDTLHFTLHYPEGQFISNDPLDQQLDSLLGAAGFYDTDYTTNIQQVFIFGHTDSKGSRKKNQELSIQRARYVQEYLMRIENMTVFIPAIVMGMGEDEPIGDNATETGRAANRRVTVRILYKREKIDKKPLTLSYRDTVIYFADGARLKINIQDYDNIKTCLTYARKTTLYDLLEELKFRSEPGYYYNLGKVSLQWCSGKCLRHFATLSIPVPDSITKKYLPDLRAFIRNYPVRANRRIKLIKHSDRKWYVDIASDCDFEWIGCINCGTSGGGEKPKKVRIVARNGYRLVYGSIHGNYSGLFMYSGAVATPKRKLKFEQTCPGQLPRIEVLAIKKHHTDTLYYANGTEATIAFRRRCFNCVDKKTVIAKVLGIKIYKRLLRRKYIIRETDYSKKMSYRK